MIEMLKSKIHGAVVTQADIHYKGSITISKEIAIRAGLNEYEKVLVVDVDNGNRFETYVILTGEERVFCVNGAAARLVSVSDQIIIMSFVYICEPLHNNYKPIILLMDDNNNIEGNIDV